MTVGIAHVEGDYSVDNGQSSFLLDGIQSIKDIGALAVKLFIGDKYDAWYPETWTGSINDLTSLCQAEPLVTALDDPEIDTYYLNAFTFVNDGTNDLWKFGFKDQPSFLQDEYDEVKALAEYLITNYEGSGKTFVLQNWEGDWSLIGSTEPEDYVPPQRTDYMIAWLQTRQRAVEDARRNLGQPGVSVLHAVELNRVVDAFHNNTIRRVVTKVLPRVRADAVSYSAYDALYDLSVGGSPYHNSYTEWRDAMVSRVTDALALIRSHAPYSTVYIGEWGIAENEAPYDLVDMFNDIVTEFDAQSLFGHVYWQIWDNESPRGFGLQTSGGSLSTVGSEMQSYLS